jgi:TRAP-type C4-dicarboxylate transport system substrate-binding protein
MTRTRLMMSAMALTAVSALTVSCAGAQQSDGTGGAQTLEEMEPIVLTVSDPLPSTSTGTIAMTNFIEDVRERSGGKIDFEQHVAGALHPITEGLQAIESGLSDITLLIPGLYSAELPVAYWTQDVAALSAGEPPEDALAGSAAIAGTWATSEEVVEELAAHNAMPLSTFQASAYSLLCTEPVTSMEDLQGLRVRAQPPQDIEVDALGMVSTYIANNETYEALQRGVIDCSVGTLSNFIAEGIWEVGKYWMPLPFSGVAAVGYIMNQNTWDGLPEPAKEILLEARASLQTELSGQFAAEYEAWLDEAPGMGVDFLDPIPEAVALVRASQEARAAELATSAPSSVSDPDAVIAQYRAFYDEWEAQLRELGVEPNDGTIEGITAATRAANALDWNLYEQATYDFLASTGYGGH